jgi:hypothetical protein
MQGRDDLCTFANGRRDTFRRSGPNVANGKDALAACLKLMPAVDRGAC